MPFLSRLTWGVTLSLLVLHGVAVFVDVPVLWGVDAWRFLSRPMQVVCGLCLCALCIPATMARIVAGTARRLETLGAFLRSHGSRRWHAGIAVAVAGVTPLLWTQTYFLGDGYKLLRGYAEGLIFSPRQPLVALLIGGIGRLWGLSTPDHFLWVFRIISVVAAAGFVYLVLRLQETVAGSPTARGLLVVTLLLTGATLFLTGYVENYTLLMVGVLWFLRSGVSTMTTGTSPFAAGWWFMVCVLLHLGSLVLLPAVVLAYLGGGPPEATLGARLRRVCIHGGLLFLGPAALVGALSLVNPEHPAAFVKELQGSHALPLWRLSGDPIVAYPVWSLTHTLDLVNLFLLIAPAAAVLLPAVVVHGRALCHSDAVARFLLVASAGYVAFASVHNMELGVSRDWDIFAIAAVPLTLTALWIVRDLPLPWLRTVGALTAVYVVLHTAPWLVINHDRESGLGRMMHLTTTPWWSPFARAEACDELRTYYWREQKDWDAAIPWARAARTALDTPRLRQALVVSLTNRGVSLVEQQQPAEAAALLREAWEADSTAVDARMNYAVALIMQDQYSEAVPHLTFAAARAPDDPLVYRNLMGCYMALKDYPRAQMALDHLVRLEGRVPEDMQNLAALLQARLSATGRR